jgi:hypothetical protein
MTAAPPQRDSVLDALGYAFRVLGKPAFLWPPALLYAILMLPVIPLMAMPGMSGTTPTFATPEEVDAFFRTFIPVILGTVVVSLVVTPVLSAVMYRLAQQYIDGEEPRPFASGIVDLALRYFLQTLVFVMLIVAAFVALAVVFLVLQAIAGLGLAILVCFIGGLIAYIYVVLRLALSPVLLLSGAGPVQAIRMSWELTRGHMARMFRWLFVSGLIVGLAASLIGAVFGAIFGIIGQPLLGQFVGTVIAGPFGLIATIVAVLLVRLLSNPLPPPPPAAALPDWMNPTGPTADGPATQATEGG